MFLFFTIDKWCWGQVEFHGQVNMPFQTSDDFDDMLGEIMFHFKRTQSGPLCIWEKEVHGLTLVPEDDIHFYLYCCWPNGTDIMTSRYKLSVSHLRTRPSILGNKDESVYEQLFITSLRPRVTPILHTTPRRRFGYLKHYFTNFPL